MAPEHWSNAFQRFCPPVLLRLRVTREVPSAPAAPDPPVVVGRTTSSLTLRWAPPSADGGLPVTSYHLTLAAGTVDAGGQFQEVCVPFHSFFPALCARALPPWPLIRNTKSFCRVPLTPLSSGEGGGRGGRRGETRGGGGYAEGVARADGWWARRKEQRPRHSLTAAGGGGREARGIGTLRSSDRNAATDLWCGLPPPVVLCDGLANGADDGGSALSLPLLHKRSYAWR